MKGLQKNLDSDLRAAFAKLADELIPRYGKMPAASEVLVHGEMLDRALGAREDLLEPLVRGLQEAKGSGPRPALQALYEKDREAFEAIGTLASGAYYMVPEVRKLIGYPGQESIETPNPYGTRDYVLDGTLKRVFERGPIYVPTPGTSAKAHDAPFGKGENK